MEISDAATVAVAAGTQPGCVPHQAKSAAAPKQDLRWLRLDPHQGIASERRDTELLPPREDFISVMHTIFTGDDRILLERYVESVLLRFQDGKYNLLDATQEFAQAFTQAAARSQTLLDHMRGVIEAGDDA
jgi:hypothetical protein